MKKNEKMVLIPACLTKAQLEKATIELAARKVNVEENVDLHDGEHEEEKGMSTMAMTAVDTDGDA